MSFEIGVNAVIFGLPLVMMELTKRTATNVKTPRGMMAPVNQFSHVPRFPSADFKQVVRANVDTLYSSAFLDLSAEPIVLTVPDTENRYYLLPMFDAWTNVFASPGTRTTGNGAGSFAIVGPSWDGPLPSELQVLRAPTNMVWILGRTQTNGPDDYDAVHAIQKGFELVPLSKLGATDYTPPEGACDPSYDRETPPVEKLAKMGAASYFGLLAQLLASNPPSAADAPMVAELAKIGIVAGQPVVQIDPALEGCVVTALERLEKSRKSAARVKDGWGSLGASLGAYGTDYVARAIVALIGFGANLPADAIYPTAYTDDNHQPLDGASRYVLHFEEGQTPPVDAFWSITLYDSNSFFVDNELHRFALSSWMPLMKNPDGSLDLFIQHESPGKDREANWLPAPRGRFNLTMRMYLPKATPPSILDGSWSPPAVRRYTADFDGVCPETALHTLQAASANRS